jgi:hypothetical protein
MNKIIKRQILIHLNRIEVITATMFLWWVLHQLLFPTFTVLLERRKKWKEKAKKKKIVKRSIITEYSHNTKNKPNSTISQSLIHTISKNSIIQSCSVCRHSSVLVSTITILLNLWSWIQFQRMFSSIIHSTSTMLLFSVLFSIFTWIHNILSKTNSFLQFLCFLFIWSKTKNYVNKKETLKREKPCLFNVCSKK